MKKFTWLLLLIFSASALATVTDDQQYIMNHINSQAFRVQLGDVIKSIDTQVNTLGVSQTLQVDCNKGVDATCTGSVNSPCKSLAKAQTLFSDQSAAKLYTINIAGGTCLEAPTYSPKQYVHLNGSGRGVTSIKHSDNSTIFMTYDGVTFLQVFKDLTFSNGLTIVRNFVGTPTLVSQIQAEIDFLNVRIAGTTNLVGSGHSCDNCGAGPFNFDTMVFTNSLVSAVNANAVNLQLNSTLGGNITYTDIGVDARVPSASGGLVESLTNSSVAFVAAAGFVNPQLRATKTTRFTLNDVNALFNWDAISAPNGNVAQFYNATQEVTQLTFSQPGTFYDVAGAAKAIQLFTTTVGHYYWISVTGGSNVQTDPVLTGTGHQVAVLPTDTSAQVATKLSVAIAATTGSVFSGTTNFSPSQVNVFATVAGVTTDGSVTGSAAAISTIVQGSATLATMAQQNTGTLATRLRNPVRTALTTPVAVNPDTDLIINSNLTAPGPVAVTMPLMTAGFYAQGRQFTLQDKKGDAFTNPITATANTGDTFENGTTTYVINENGASVTFYYDTTVWRVLSKREGKVFHLDSSAGVGGASSEALTVTGLLATDEILSVDQKTPGTNSLNIIGWTTQANNALTVQWPADPGAGTIARITVKR